MPPTEFVIEVPELQRELVSLLPMSNERADQLRRKMRLEFHYNSNHIEGNTLTYSETELLLIFDETRGNHTFREYEEMKASEVALKLVEELAKDKEQPLTESFIKNLNKVLLVEPFWKDAITPDGNTTKRKIDIGVYKNYPNSVRLKTGEIFNYPSPAETPILMGELLSWYKNELSRGEISALELAATLHYKFVRIHPFDDGNGRIARLLMNYVLMYHDLPMIIVKSVDKDNYLRALRDADAGNIIPFIAYLGEQLIWSLSLSIKAAKGESIEEEDDWKKDLSLLKTRLHSQDSLRILKSQEVVYSTIISKIVPFVEDLSHSLSDINDLFLTKSLIVEFRKDDRRDLSYLATMPKDEIIANFFNVMNISIWFNDFTKNGHNPFSLRLQFRFNFQRHSYDLLVDQGVIHSKLYHQSFSDAEVKSISNRFGRTLYEEIKNRVE